jgi:uncharacterized ubiquitin-like protein YukD
MEHTYTNYLCDSSFELFGIDEEVDDYRDAIRFLNDPNSFRTFGDGLIFLMNQKYPSLDIDRSNVLSILKNFCKENKVEIKEIGSQGTLSNWFKGGLRPKKGEVSREALFAFAFALNLNIDETRYLFNKIYLDRAFNYRNEKEVVYYFCLNNGASYLHAKELIETINKSSQSFDDHTQNTTVLQNDASVLKDEKELITYICSNGHNFEKDSQMAKVQLERLKNEAIDIAQKERILPENQNEYFSRKWKNSKNSLFEIITGASVTGSRGTKTIFKNAQLPKEIKNRFPEALSLSKKEMSSEERRKLIIMLFSYINWYKAKHKANSDKEKYDIEDYTPQLDDLLEKCNYSPLYFGNPYDWMFLFCTLSENPLATFRELLSEVLYEESD